jgi:hypothetical protein
MGPGDAAQHPDRIGFHPCDRQAQKIRKIPPESSKTVACYKALLREGNSYEREKLMGAAVDASAPIVFYRIVSGVWNVAASSLLAGAAGIGFTPQMPFVHCPS